MKKCPATVLLVDGDILLYRFAFTNATKIDWGDDCVTTSSNLDKAIFDTDQFILGLIEKTGTVKVIVCLTGSLNFRYEVLPSYKANRADKEKPELLDGIRDHLQEAYSTRLKEGLEADDVMGILSTRTPDKYIIASADKDMQTIPGWLFDWKDNTLRYVTEKEADYNFYTQILTGDTADGFKGCPGIGPKKAEKILDGCLEAWKPYVWERIVEAYEAKGLTEEDAIVQARVARILRAEDYNFETKEVKLWTPPSYPSTE